MEADADVEGGRGESPPAGVASNCTSSLWIFSTDQLRYKLEKVTNVMWPTNLQKAIDKWGNPIILVEMDPHMRRGQPGRK